MPDTPSDYLRDPAAIYEHSFAIIEAEAGAGLRQLPAELRPVARRLIHSCGMTDILADLAWRGPVVEAARTALEQRCPILVDVEMVAAGIIKARLPAGVAVRCGLGDPRVPALARELGTTRSAAAVELWRDDLQGAVVVVGNAPTALFHLLDRLGDWPERPAAILAFPVGFVGAAESKEALIEAELDIPWLTLRGRRGGSALAAAAVNGLMDGAQVGNAPAAEAGVDSAPAANAPAHTAPTDSAPTANAPGDGALVDGPR